METELYRYGDVSIYVAEIDHDKSVASSPRERERIAERTLIRQLLGDKVMLTHDENGRPRLEGVKMYISISHSRHKLCIALSETTETGVDIEELQPRLEEVKYKYMTEGALGELREKGSLAELALCWSAKEAVYKLAGEKAGALGENVVLEGLANMRERGVFQARIGEERFDIRILKQTATDEIVIACRCMNI